MEKLVRGVGHFQRQVFRPRREQFAQLAKGQSPLALFITCSDSRIDPNLITQTDPGELFIVRNAGNIVPPYGAVFGGEAATIEYAVTALGIKDLIICGHTGCGAIKALAVDGSQTGLTAIDAWLKHAEGTRRLVASRYSHLSGDDLIAAAARENVLFQLDHLRTHPAVSVGLARGEIKLHAWMYHLDTGVVAQYDSSNQSFRPILDVDTLEPRGAESRSSKKPSKGSKTSE
jgi:carbonic anhydrase